MAVFFGQKALTFDQAPFANSALALTDGVDSVGNPIIADNASMLAQRLAALADQRNPRHCALAHRRAKPILAAKHMSSLQGAAHE
jgi:hypothetical protein